MDTDYTRKDYIIQETPYHSKKAKARGRQMLNTKVVKDWLSDTHKER